MTEEIFLSHMARVRLLEDSALGELRQLLQERGYAGETDPESLFFWRAEISNTLLDSHFTHMNEKTLRNYAEDSEIGVSFLRGHRRTDLAVGYSLRGTLEDEGTRKRVVTDFYTIRGLHETDDLIRRMQGGLVRDVSVGFHGGEYWCDICRQTFWDCMHWPGMKYEVKDGDQTKMVVATYEIDDARLSEVSGVYDGSTPSAMILKAQRMASAGLIDQKQIAILEQRYRVKLPSPPRSFAVNSTQKQDKERMMELTLDEKQLERVVGVFIDQGVIPADKRETVEAKDIGDAVVTLATRYMRRESAAKDGEQYREDLVNAAIAEGVRAHGNDFKADNYRMILTGAPLETIKGITSDFKKVADQALPAGRSSVQEDQTPTAVEVDFAPDSVYA